MKGTPFNVLSGKTKRISFAGIDKGPVKIISNVNIVASERIIYRLLSGVPVSFTEVMALPKSQLDTIYWMPFYTKNSTVDTQLRFGNVSATPATVRVYIRGVEMPGSPFSVPVGTSKRVMFTGVNTGTREDREQCEDRSRCTRDLYGGWQTHQLFRDHCPAQQAVVLQVLDDLVQQQDRGHAAADRIAVINQIVPLKFRV